MKAWISERKALLSNLFHDQTLVTKFTEELYLNRSIKISSEERVKFETLREEEFEEYRWRKILFFPAWIGSVLVLDTLYVIPATQTNFGR
jgi:hypothetical protein